MAVGGRKDRPALAVLQGEAGSMGRLSTMSSLVRCFTTLTAIALLGMLGARSAQAGYAHSEFDISGSQVFVEADLGVVITLTIPFQDGDPMKPTGTVSGSFGAVSPVQGSELDKASSGVGAITNLSLNISLDADYSLIYLWGQIDSRNIGWGLGSFDASGVVTSPGTGLVIQTDTYLECSSPLNLCPTMAQRFAGNFPQSRVTTKAQTEGNPFTVTVNSINAVDSAWFVATLTLDIGSPNATQTTPATIILDGREIPGTRSMTSLVPEPETLTLVAAGVAGLVLIGGGAIRARRNRGD